MTRATVESVPRLDVRACVRLARGGRGGPRARRASRVRSDGSWSYSGITSRGTVNGEEVWSLSASIEVRGSSGSLRFAYQSRGASHAPVVELEAEPMRFGGARWWARCPVCSRRCAGLFVSGPRVACRRCFGLAYTSTRETEEWRAHRLVDRYAKRLEPDGDRRSPYSAVDLFPPKPPRMRWATYDRILARVEPAQHRAAEAFTAGLQRFAANAERAMGRR